VAFRLFAFLNSCATTQNPPIGARLWINHDMAQSSAIPKAPAFVE
jgi:hypothetical protein